MLTFGFADQRPMTPNPQFTAPNPDIDEEPLDDEESIGDEISETLVALMPWGISILFHVALVVAAFFFVWQVILIPEEEEPIIPDAAFSETPGAPDPVQTVQEESSESPRTTPTVDPTVNTPNPTINNTNIQSQSIGMTATGGISGASFGTGNGNGDHGASMFGNGGNARNIAFVVDASGSMVGVLPFVINELKRVINGLENSQKFTIIFFTGEGVFEVPGGGRRQGLRPATAEFKQQASQWITLDNHNVEPHGRGSVNAIAAIEQALSHRPQLVFLLSDNLTGGGQGATIEEIFQADVMEAIADANDYNPPAKFNTIQFLYSDPLVNAGLTGTLERIADETGGNYKFLDERELHLR